MNRLMIQIIALFLTAFISINIHASATGFIGTEVVGAVYCCTANDRISNELIIEVGPEIEYQSIENSGENVVGANIDISDTWIDIDFTVKGWSSSGDFNGYIFDFSSINPEVPLPEIASLSLNSASTFSSDDIGLSFDTDTIRISLPNLPITPSSSIRVDVVFVPPPEDDCVIDYTIKGPLKIPCLSQPSENGEMILEVDMKLSPWPGCDYRIDSVNNLFDQDTILDKFESEFISRSDECVVSIIHYSTKAPNQVSDTETWTIAGFNDDLEFVSTEIDSQNTELLTELNLTSQNKGQVVEQITALLGRTPLYDPLAYTIDIAQQVDSSSINTDDCQANTINIFDPEGEGILRLLVPCISIRDSIGEIGRYQAVFEEMPGSSQTTFVLINSAKVEQP